MKGDFLCSGCRKIFKKEEKFPIKMIRIIITKKIKNNCEIKIDITNKKGQYFCSLKCFDKWLSFFDLILKED